VKHWALPKSEAKGKLPFGPPYFNFGQSISCKSMVLLGTHWQLVEPFGNMMRTPWELDENPLGT